MSNTSKNLLSLDFEPTKENLKEFLKTQDIFKDYDFEGSNINVLLDVLAYNTNLNAFYLNMLASEMFLDSAIMRDSIISHAKELNYLPRSFRSATATVNITVHDNNVASVLIPKGTSFAGLGEGRSFTFTTNDNIILSGSNGVFTGNNITLYEGSYTQDRYVVNSSNPSRYIISNRTVDTNSITVVVLEDNGATTLEYKKTETLFGLNKNSLAYFIQPSENETYEIVFGDGVIGRRPKNNSIVIIQYRICNGELPNGIKRFKANDDIGTSSSVEVETVSMAAGGSIPESLSSIKINAPRAFTTQERVVTASDYEILLKTNFSEINEVSVYGGEEATPPQYGKVIIAVDLKTTDELPIGRIEAYERFIKPRSPLAIDPVFVRPDYTYVRVMSRVKYDINQTSLTTGDIKTLVTSSIQNYNLSNINGFNRTLYYSNLVSTIDNSHPSVISNDTDVLAVKLVTFDNSRLINDVDFGFVLDDSVGLLNDIRSPNEESIIYSSPFRYRGKICHLEDDGEGVIRIVTEDGSSMQNIMKVKDIGTVNYNTGLLQIETFDANLYGSTLRIYARARDKDITSQRRTILRIPDDEIIITIEQSRL